MCSAVGSARANAVFAVPIAVAIETRDAGRTFRYITVSLDLTITDFKNADFINTIMFNS